jgi:antitoxin MazE
MQDAKWGNSLAVRIPAAIVEALGLKEGDKIDIRVAGEREFDIERDLTRERALQRMRESRFPLPPGLRFDRDDANERLSGFSGVCR